MAPCTNVNHSRRQKRGRTATLFHAEIRRQAARIALQAFSAATSRRSLLNTNSLGYLPRVDILDDPSSPNMVAIFELPGVRRDQILVTISQGIMHVHGKRVQRSLREHCPGAVPPSSDNCAPQAPVRSPVQELRYGCFGRGVKLPEGVREDDLTTSLNDGLFVVTWPRQAKATPPPGEGRIGEACSGV